MKSDSKNVFVNKRPGPKDDPDLKEVLENRRRCAYCGKLRPVHYETTTLYGSQLAEVPIELRAKHERKSADDQFVFFVKYTGDWRLAGWYAAGRLCSTLCCEKFASAALNAGYCIKKKRDN